uniref:Uncharacterized protein n=1 Tax=Pyxicephalus adspersus TaxID=30357 RepID=A0A499QMB6_PYXAD|nr:hypothetical protein maker-240M17-exonerate_protein2genome-gene-0.6 [Pyxicephalus adspersus]AWH61115.1 hypothetical protein maker-33C18-exonerate_protein2genome-gene-0.8 [Pyxicephalus adspersus]
MRSEIGKFFPNLRHLIRRLHSARLGDVGGRTRKKRGEDVGTWLPLYRAKDRYREDTGLNGRNLPMDRLICGIKGRCDFIFVLGLLPL